MAHGATALQRMAANPIGECLLGSSNQSIDLSLGSSPKQPDRSYVQTWGPGLEAGIPEFLNSLFVLIDDKSI